MQQALATKLKGRVSLRNGVQDALNDFWWMLDQQLGFAAYNDSQARPSAIVSGGAASRRLGRSSKSPRAHKPVILPLQWWQEIIDRLVTAENPSGDISNLTWSWRADCCTLTHWRKLST